MKLTRNLYVPCLDTSEGSGTSTWVPIDLSTVFELSWNPNEETYSYICYQNDTTEVTGYAPQLPQEIVLDNTNAMYKYLYKKFMTMPTGSDLVVPFLLVSPDADTGKDTDGYLWKQAQLSPQSLNTVDGKLSFNINLNGSVEKGTAAIASDGTITYTAPSASAGA